MERFAKIAKRSISDVFQGSEMVFDSFSLIQMFNLFFSGQQLVRNEDGQTPQRQASNNNIQSDFCCNDIFVNTI